jgi:uncharacterized protein with PQ loop repeat
MGQILIASERGMDYMTMIGLAAAALGGIWLVYGILMENSPIIIANFFGFIQALIILLFKLKYK